MIVIGEILFAVGFVIAVTDMMMNQTRSWAYIGVVMFVFGMLLYRLGGGT